MEGPDITFSISSVSFSSLLLVVLRVQFSFLIFFLFIPFNGKHSSFHLAVSNPLPHHLFFIFRLVEFIHFFVSLSQRFHFFLNVVTSISFPFIFAIVIYSDCAQTSKLINVSLFLKIESVN
jgi:hypothetical protein